MGVLVPLVIAGVSAASGVAGTVMNATKDTPTAATPVNPMAVSNVVGSGGSATGGGTETEAYAAGGGGGGSAVPASYSSGLGIGGGSYSSQGEAITGGMKSKFKL